MGCGIVKTRGNDVIRITETLGANGEALLVVALVGHGMEVGDDAFYERIMTRLERTKCFRVFIETGRHVEKHKSEKGEKDGNEPIGPAPSKPPFAYYDDNADYERQHTHPGEYPVGRLLRNLVNGDVLQHLELIVAWFQGPLGRMTTFSETDLTLFQSGFSSATLRTGLNRDRR
jgi:hypothetical protein